MWVNPAVCQSNKDFKMKIWLQKHAKMTFDFKDKVDWIWKGREEILASVQSLKYLCIIILKMSDSSPHRNYPHY